MDFREEYSSGSIGDVCLFYCGRENLSVKSMIMRIVRLFPSNFHIIFKSDTNNFQIQLSDPT